MSKIFCFTNYATDYSKAIMKLINKMGWEIICKEEGDIITKIEVCIPEEDTNILDLIQTA